MSLQDATSLTDLIQEGKNNPYRKKDYSKFIQLGNNILTVGGNFIDKYWDFIEANKIKVNLEKDGSYIKYKYRPKDLSLLLYGTEELYYILLRLNNISHETEFIKKIIYVADRKSIKIILNKIISLNEGELTLNHREYK